MCLLPPLPSLPCTPCPLTVFPPASWPLSSLWNKTTQTSTCCSCIWVGPPPSLSPPTELLHTVQIDHWHNGWYPKPWPRCAEAAHTSMWAGGCSFLAHDVGLLLPSLGLFRTQSSCYPLGDQEGLPSFTWPGQLTNGAGALQSE